MSDLVQLASGAAPWQPTVDAEELVRLDEYNIPLAGLLRQRGFTYLYVCAAGEEDSTNVWLYARVTPEEGDALKASRGDEVVAMMKRSLENRLVMAALADEWKLVLWDHFDVGL